MSIRDEIEEVVRRVVREELAARGSVANPDPLECFTPSEAAARLKLDGDTIRTYCDKGIIRAKKIGGKWRIKRADLEDFIERANFGDDTPDPREVALAIVHGKR